MSPTPPASRGTGYDMGVAVGDYDNDGHPDIFVAGLHRNTLYHNNGDGTFTDVTAKAGLDRSNDPEYGPLWSITAAWVDVNNDGTAGPVRRQLHAVELHGTAAVLVSRGRRLLPSPVLQGATQSALPEQRRRHVRGCLCRRGAFANTWAKAWE